MLAGKATAAVDKAVKRLRQIMWKGWGIITVRATDRCAQCAAACEQPWTSRKSHINTMISKTRLPAPKRQWPRLKPMNKPPRHSPTCSPSALRTRTRPSVLWITAADVGRRDPFSRSARRRAVRALAAAAAGDAAAKALSFEHVAAKDWVRESLAGLQPVAGRALRRAWRARSRPHPAQPHRHRDRSGARLRHRPSRHHARLPAGARIAMCKRLRKKRAAHSRPRHRLRRARHRRGARVAPARAGDRHRPRGGARRARQCPAQPRRRSRRNRAAPTASRATPCVRARRSISIFANILLGPLQRFAAPLTRLIAPGGAYRAVRPAGRAGQCGNRRLSTRWRWSGASSSTAGRRWC